jgi:nitrite reductase/ring-hydroxylating ferredoxin subunit/uncharacterized membrane protein
MANRITAKLANAKNAKLKNADVMNTLLDQITDRIERLKGLDPLADRLADWVAPLYANRRVVNVASGTPLGHPLHPLLVTVPIGAYSAAFLFDALKDEDAADTMIALGIASSLPAAYTGLSDWRDTQGAERRVGLVHAASNTVSLVLFGASWLARKKGDRTRGVTLALAGATFVSLGGWLGGHLIYALGVGVDTTAFQQAPEDWTYAAQESEVTEGSLTMGAVNGVPLVLTRLAGGKIVVYADRCSHRGGPLHEGQLVDDCIECPWHQSRFSVTDGAVVQGPATRPQPAYEVRVNHERVEVRRSDEVRALRTNPVGR